MSRRLAGLAARLIVFALAFSIDVRARASEAAAKAIVSLSVARAPADHPRGCARSSSVTACAAMTGPKERLDLELTDGRISLDGASAAARSGPDRAIFLSGQAFVRSEGSVVVETEFGEAIVEGGEAWISRADGKIWIDALAGSVALAPRGSRGAAVAVPPGMRNWLGPVGRKGVAEIGFPSSIDFPAHLARRARVFEGGKTEFMEEAEAFSELWKEAVRTTASLDERRAQERRAAIQEEDRKRAAIVAAREARNKELRTLFRRKAFE